MVRGLLIAILALLQLPQAIAGSVAICFCSTGIVAADETRRCDHCDGSCHESKPAGGHDETGCDSGDDHSCHDCLHVSFFAGDNLRSTVTWATPETTPTLATIASPPTPTCDSLDHRSHEAPAVFWLSVSGSAIALRC